MKRKFYLKVGLGIWGLMILGAAIWLLWSLWSWIRGLDGGLLATWAILATLGLPAIAWASWRLGHLKSTGVLEGLDKGIDKVVTAATKLRTKEPKASIQVAVLPQLPQPPQVVHRQLTTGDEVIDL